MKMIKRYAGILMMLTLLVGFTSCESEEETEFNLPGEWRWIDGGYNSMELFFYGDRTYAYIWGAEATGRTFSGTWYNNWQDFRDRIDGQPFYMRRQ